MPEMRAYLTEQKVWFIVSGKDTKPLDAAQAVVWCNKAAAAAGAIYRVLELLCYMMDQFLLISH
jgi:hypothetical protein